MMFEQVIKELVPPPPNHTRVYRVEHKRKPMSGGWDMVFDKISWGNLPIPQEDYPKVDMKDYLVCAATPSQFGDWFPDEVLSFLSDYERVLVVLDVPNEHITVTSRQAVLLRSAATCVLTLQ